MLTAKKKMIYDSIKITYIANAGFVIEGDGKKIIIDGIFKSSNQRWCDSPGDSVIGAMLSGSNPFCNIDLIAITHYHEDHFDPHLVIKVMENNPQCLTLCPVQVFQRLRRYKLSNKLEKRIISLSPPAYCDSQIVVDDIPIRILRLEHSHSIIYDNEKKCNINKHESVENLGYIFELGGYTIFHSGDANPHNTSEFEIFELGNEMIDIAFIDRLFFLNGPESAKIIEQHIVPETIIIMQINPDQKDYFYHRFINCDRVRFFKRSLETFEYNVKGGVRC